MFYHRVEAVDRMSLVPSYGSIEIRPVDERPRWRTSNLVAISVLSLFGLAVIFLIWFMFMFCSFFTCFPLHIPVASREQGSSSQPKDCLDLRSQTYAVGFDLTAGYG